MQFVQRAQTGGGKTYTPAEMAAAIMEINSADAYEVYLKNGGSLSLQEWLESLKGQNGITPHIGANGNWWIGETDSGVKAHGLELDTTLTVNGKAADAKTTGDRFNELSGEIEDKLDSANLHIAVDSALAQAKASGEFDGADGKSAYQLYVDNGGALTETQWLASLAQTEPPEIVDSVDDMTDTSKVYVLSTDGMIYAYTTFVTPGGIPLFTNVLETASYELNKRYNSSNTLKDANGHIAVDYIPVNNGDVIRFRSPNGEVGSTGYSNLLTGIQSRVRFFTSENVLTASGAADAVPLTNYFYCVNESDGVTALTVGLKADGSAYSDAAGIVKMRCNLNYTNLGSAITSANVAGTIVTINQPIAYSEAGTVTTWASTGLAYSPADYEERIIALENNMAELKSTAPANRSALGLSEVYAPSPQLPADGSETADIDAHREVITANDIYDYLAPLLTKYPRYITLETMGKDESGSYDWNRYVCCSSFYKAWQKTNYPAMYGWVNGDTILYSTSVSPRIGDDMYTEATTDSPTENTVTAVDNANQTRTVSGLAFTRDRTKDVAPALVYTSTYYTPHYSSHYTGYGNQIYNSSGTQVASVSALAGDVLTDSNGNTYTRYPLGDLDESRKKIPAIFIGSNEHGTGGDHAGAAVITARLIKDLCECKNAQNPMLNLLKNEYMMVFCPVINPWGFSAEHQSYVNSNCVNLDRNLDTPGWGNDVDGTLSVAGAYGGSEVEMQYFMNTLVESGAKIALANHGVGSPYSNLPDGGTEFTSAGFCHWMLGRNNSKYDSALKAIGKVMSANYNLAFTDYGQAPPETYGKTRSYMDWVGVEGGALEMQAVDGFVLQGEGQLFTSRIMEANYTLVLQFLAMLIEHQA